MVTEPNLKNLTVHHPTLLIPVSDSTKPPTKQPPNMPTTNTNTNTTTTNRLSNITSLINGDDESDPNSGPNRFAAAEEIILRWDSHSDTTRRSWIYSPEDAAEFLGAVDEILQLFDDLSIQNDNEFMDRAESAIQLAMSRLEGEFRHALIRNSAPLNVVRLFGQIRSGSSSFGTSEGEIDNEFDSFGEVDFESSGCFHDQGASLGDDVCVDLINPDTAVVALKEIADRMIRSGYEKKCVRVYSNVRRDFWDECLVFLGVEKLSIEEVQKFEWTTLKEKIKKWIPAVKIAVRFLLSGEKKLCDLIFSGSDSSKEVCFNETVKGCVMQLLSFGEAVAIGKRSPEKLFRILDMYDALADLVPDLQGMITDEFVCSEADGVLAMLGGAAKGTFAEFENNVQNESSKKPMQSGEIHPLARFVMNYVSLLVDYSETLNKLLESDEDESGCLESDDNDRLQIENMSLIGRRLFLLISALGKDLEEKSRLYDDVALQYVFLMNNNLYIVQKVKDSELGKLLGDHWVRKCRGRIRQYATSYLRASWSKVLYCLKDEGIGGSTGNATKVTLKERFKSFNACFEEIYRIQTGWRVPDAQLREELQISISEKVLPAYRTFMGRFGSQLESGRNAGKYIKYTPDDLEGYLLDLFEGSPGVLRHLRRKSSS